MQSFSTFCIESFSFDADTLTARFNYSFDRKVHFQEQIDFACPGFAPLPSLDPLVVDNLLFHLSLAIGISYYKLFPTAEIHIYSGHIKENQMSFWRSFYINGLGEYFFKNNISPTWLVHFVNQAPVEQFPFLQSHFSCHQTQAMVAIGWGKDSLVSRELLKKANIPFFTSTFGKDYRLHQNVSERIWVARLVMKRTIDPLLFEMNQQGYYNGHVPISGIIAFVLTTAAYLYNYSYIVMSNERSADEGNTEMDGVIINHQWSKSFEFEEAFSQYLHNYISPDLWYFSLLRSMYEIKIAEFFSKYAQYFDVFSSCNTNFKVNEDSDQHIGSANYDNQRRCGKCPKCAFVYTILRSFISKEDTQQIFGKELFEDESLTPTFEALLGISGIKPFECVGTNEEMVLAMKKCYDLRTQTYQEELPYMLNLFADKILPQMQIRDFISLEKKLMTIGDQDLVPPEIRSALFL